MKPFFLIKPSQPRISFKPFKSSKSFAQVNQNLELE